MSCGTIIKLEWYTKLPNKIFSLNWWKCLIGRSSKFMLTAADAMASSYFFWSRARLLLWHIVGISYTFYGGCILPPRLSFLPLCLRHQFSSLLWSTFSPNSLLSVMALSWTQKEYHLLIYWNYSFIHYSKVNAIKVSLYVIMPHIFSEFQKQWKLWLNIAQISLCFKIS